MAQIIDGKAIARKIRREIAAEVDLLAARGVRPGLAVILVGENPASKVYVSMKEKACRDVGIFSDEYILPADTGEAEILALIAKLNGDERIHGILVQLPLPKQMDDARILEAISPDKDVDGFHPFNMGRLIIGRPVFQPCTPYGIMVLLKEAGIELKGKEVVIVGRSNIVGKPVAFMCLQQHATVTICHTRTVDLPAKIGAADVLIVAAGKPEVVRGEWIKEGAVVIDVGVNRLADNKLVGDVEFETAARRASHITPVPGGVGPMTITMLLRNTLQSAQMWLEKTQNKQ
jgi:methylenetetrahydrofolate dehydrogenase (NADP+)/methenyltetrahydrofolate cyclohydrolase